MADPLLLGMFLCLGGAIGCLIVAALCWIADHAHALLGDDEDWETEEDLWASN